LQGIWNLVGLHLPGEKPRTGEHLGGVVIQADRFLWVSGGVFDAKFELAYPLSKQRKINVLSVADPRDQLRGIYSMDGDTLKICLPMESGFDRPTEFAAGGENYATLLTLERMQGAVLAAGETIEFTQYSTLKSVGVSDPAIAEVVPIDGKTIRVKARKVGSTLLTTLDENNVTVGFGVIVPRQDPQPRLQLRSKHGAGATRFEQPAAPPKAPLDGSP